MGRQGDRQHAFAPSSPVVAFRVPVFPLRPEFFHERLDADDPRAFFGIGAPHDPVNVAIGFRREQRPAKRVMAHWPSCQDSVPAFRLRFRAKTRGHNERSAAPHSDPNIRLASLLKASSAPSRLPSENIAS